MNKNREFSMHHKFPKCAGWSNHPDNLLYIQDIKHRAMHTLFDNHGIATMPHEQLNKFMDMMWETIIWEFKHDIKTIIEMYWNDIYNSNCIK